MFTRVYVSNTRASKSRVTNSLSCTRDNRSYIVEVTSIIMFKSVNIEI